MNNQKKSRKPLAVQFSNVGLAQYVKEMLDKERVFNTVRVTITNNGKAFFHTDGERQNEQIRKYLKSLVNYAET